MEQTFVVEKYDGKSDYSVHFWHVGCDISDAVWKAEAKEEGGEPSIEDYPSCFLSVGEYLYLGMNSGSIFQVNATD
jgi:hypothetical protein